MSNSAPDSVQGNEINSGGEQGITQYLTPGRIAIDLHVASKKRLLEEVAALLLKDQSGLDKETVFQVLFERERLGSTGIGYGVALPHGRVNGIDEPILAVAKLRRPLDFDAPDQQPVELIIALLVPADATQTHLQLLAALASLLNQEEVRTGLSNAAHADEVINWLGKNTESKS
ncbi:MAG: PTS sugar transporter subunit IIA [Gammaproteobacteria bacterium]|nr:PTS sugar transporter subunit IIA [Gammaproteobacteria bacterium]